MTGRKRRGVLKSGSSPTRMSTRGRLLTLVAAILLCSVAILPRIASAENPYSSITPKSQDADDIQLLYKIIFWIALAAFIGVQAAVVFTVMRYRQRHADEPRPEQSHGNHRLEVVWTIIPALILVAIFIPSVRTMFRIDDRVGESTYTIEVYGKQWWWEVHYKEPEAVANVVTANEIYIPTNTRVRIELLSANVIHSFYVPQLAGKLDVIPGHINAMSVQADEPGMYYGECAEFCGDSHAFMRFKIIAVPQDQFDLWVKGWNQGADSAAAAIAPDGNVDAVPAALALCLGCHRIGGVPDGPTGQVLQNPADGLEGGNSQSNMILGPNLSMFACRTTIAGGILPNNVESLRKWLHNPGGVKQGNFMATMITEGLIKDEDITTIISYLETLKPEEGCPEITGVNAEHVTRLADDTTPLNAASTTTESQPDDQSYVIETRLEP